MISGAITKVRRVELIKFYVSSNILDNMRNRNKGANFLLSSFHFNDKKVSVDLLRKIFLKSYRETNGKGVLD